MSQMTFAKFYAAQSWDNDPVEAIISTPRTPLDEPLRLPHNISIC